MIHSSVIFRSLAGLSLVGWRYLHRFSIQHGHYSYAGASSCPTRSFLSRSSV